MDAFTVICAFLKETDGAYDVMLDIAYVRAESVAKAKESGIHSMVRKHSTHPDDVQVIVFKGYLAPENQR